MRSLTYASLLLSLLPVSCVRAGFDAQQLGDVTGRTELGRSPVDLSAPIDRLRDSPLHDRLSTDGPTPPFINDPDLVAYWPFDEPAGATTFADLSKNNNTGTCPNNCPTVGVAGIRGNAVRFTGSSDSIAVGTGAALTSISTQLTIAVWVQIHGDMMYGHIISNDRDCMGCGGFDGFSLVGTFYNGNPEFLIWNKAEIIPDGMVWVSGQSKLNHDEWYFLVGTYDGTELRLYYNGALNGSKAYTGHIGTPPSFETQIGAMGWNQGEGINGTVDELMVFRRGLSAAEVAQLYSFYKPQ